MSDDKRLRQAIEERREYLKINGGYEADDEPTDEDALDDLMSACGQMADGSCSMAGTEYCDWDCPFS